LVPLTAMIGSGVDMSRAYMARTRLQSACDAGALAARRVLQNDTLSQAVIDEGRRFFNFNFNQGLYETAAFTPAVTRPSAGTIRMTASTTIPTTIMRMFGFNSMPLDVTCDASLNFVNTDVMLVLDTTGSMADDVYGNSTSNTADQKITALRQAVMALYDELAPIQTQLESNGLRLRYGVVPYSSTVNVGDLIRGVNSDYLRENAEYQTRVANYNTPVYTGTPGTPEAPVTQVYGSSISQSDCDKYGQNVSFGGFTPSATSGGGPAPAATWSRTFSNNEATGVDWGWSGAPDTGGSTRSCRRRYVEIDTTYVTEYTFTSWSYEAEAMDVDRFRDGNSITIATSNNGRVPTAGTYDMAELAAAGIGVSTTTSDWNGCIEERDTVSTITSTSGYTIPSTAYDLNINLVPNSDQTRWRPQWPAIAYRRSAGSTSATSGTSMSTAACPAEARRLAVWNRGNMESYMQTLSPVGSTYHDIGIVWGARMISNAGIFADSPDTFNNMPVSRHIIFMTDGQLAPSCSTYSSWGIEQNSTRVTGGSSCPDQYARHMQRFKMACNAARGLNASIWVIAFGTTLSNEMIECASNANQASTSANRDELIARFREIGSNIGALRLTQ
jgi:Flp pilus assembly protein TadG